MCVEKVSAGDNCNEHQEKESSRNGKFHYGDAALRFFAVVTSHNKNTWPDIRLSACSASG
jgi:hypothetical protein